MSNLQLLQLLGVNLGMEATMLCDLAVAARRFFGYLERGLAGVHRPNILPRDFEWMTFSCHRVLAIAMSSFI